MKNYKIVLYTMEGCPYCDELKGYMQNEGIKYKPIDIDIREKLWESVKKITGEEYVPTVMVVNTDTGSPKFFAPDRDFEEPKECFTLVKDLINGIRH
jgi:glutaredoxin